MVSPDEFWENFLDSKSLLFYQKHPESVGVFYHEMAGYENFGSW